MVRSRCRCGKERPPGEQGGMDRLIQRSRSDEAAEWRETEQEGVGYGIALAEGSVEERWCGVSERERKARVRPRPKGAKRWKVRGGRAKEKDRDRNRHSGNDRARASRWKRSGRRAEKKLYKKKRKRRWERIPKRPSEPRRRFSRRLKFSAYKRKKCCSHQASSVE